MSIELVGLAFDEKLTHRIWEEVLVHQAYDLILEDEFRRKVDLRSMLYHKGSLDLLSELEQFLRQGGAQRSMIELIADRFRSGVEEFPTASGELSFDFKLIRQFASLAMVDNFLVADPFLRLVLKKVGFLHNGGGWSLTETRDYVGVSKALQEVRVRDILDLGNRIETSGQKVSFEHLVRNYVEFLNYAANNGLTPFFYNSETDFRKWGNLAERKNKRGEMIVDLSMKAKPSKREGGPFEARKPDRLGFKEKLRRHKEIEALVGGLKDTDPLIRQKSAESLGRLAEPDLYPKLVDVLRDDEPEVRQEVVRALAATGDQRSEEVLLKVIERDEVFSVQLTAAYLLKKMNARSALPLFLDGVEQGKPHFSTLLAFHKELANDRTSQLRITALAASDVIHARREAAYVLGFLPSKLARGMLEKLVEDVDEETRANALYALWTLRDSRVEEFAKKLSNQDSEVAARAGTIVLGWVSSKRTREVN